MKLSLHRTLCGNGYTLGKLFVNGAFECDTLEDQDRGLEKHPENKVYGETCIPRGTYKVLITMSNRFKRELPLLKDVPGFEGIRIHPGNTQADTHGCILVGVLADSGDRIVMSRATFDGLFKRMEAAYDKGEDMEIEVV